MSRLLNDDGAVSLILDGERRRIGEIRGGVFKTRRTFPAHYFAAYRGFGLNAELVQKAASFGIEKFSLLVIDRAGRSLAQIARTPVDLAAAPRVTELHFEPQIIVAWTPPKAKEPEPPQTGQQHFLR